LAFGALMLTTTSLQEAKKDVQQPASQRQQAAAIYDSYRELQSTVH